MFETPPGFEPGTRTGTQRQHRPLAWPHVGCTEATCPSTPTYALAIAAPSTRIRAISSRWRSRTNSSTSRSQAEALTTQLCLWDQRFTFPQALFRGPLRFSVRHMMVTWVRRALQERARNDGGAFLGTATRKSDSVIGVTKETKAALAS